MSGIRAEIKLHSPAECPVVRLAASADARCTSISKVSEDSGTVTEEFVLDAEEDIEQLSVDAVDHEVEEVFSYGSRQAYRFERTHDGACFCEVIEDLGHPLRDVYAQANELVVVFHAPTIEELQKVLTTIQKRWPDASVHRLIQSGERGSQADLVFIDRSALTDRQREVLETAQQMGYFVHPKEANAGEVAEALDITQSTFSEHLAAAQEKLLTNILEA